jgi:hypothetical protein
MSNLNHKLLVLFHYKNRYPPLKQCKLIEIKNMVKRVVKDFAKDTSAQITTQLLSIEMEFEKLNDWKAYSVLDLSIFTAHYSEQRIGFCLRTALNY